MIKNITLGSTGAIRAYLGNNLVWLTKFSAIDAFTGNKQGCWFDLTDKSTLFQLARGASRVTKSGDPIGLMLDKSQGLDAVTMPLNSPLLEAGVHPTNSVEILPNGDIKYTLLSLSTSNFIPVPPRTLGKVYRLKLSVTGVSGSIPIREYVSSAAPILYTIESGLNNLDMTYMSSTDSTTGFYLRGSGEIIIHSMELYEIKGNHASQSVSAKRPTYREIGNAKGFYLDGVDDSINITVANAWVGSMFVAADGGVSGRGVNIPAGVYDVLTQYKTASFVSEIIIRDVAVSDLGKQMIEGYLSGKTGV